MANTESSEKISRIIVRLFFIVLSCVLLLMGYDHYKPLVVGNDRPLTDGGCAGLLYFRDKRIDRLEPTVTQTKDSAFTADEIDGAIDAFKAGFKLQKIEYGLCAVRFDEAASRRISAQLPQPESGGRYLAMTCDYNVYDDTEAGDRKGYYPNAVFILEQEPDGTWRFPYAGAQQALASPLQRLFP